VVGAIEGAWGRKIVSAEEAFASTSTQQMKSFLGNFSAVMADLNVFLVETMSSLSTITLATSRNRNESALDWLIQRKRLAERRCCRMTEVRKREELSTMEALVKSF